MSYENDYLSSRYDNEPAVERNTTRIVATARRDILQKPHYKTRKWTLIGAISMVLFFTLFGQFTADTSAVIFSSASPEIKQAGRDSGLNTHGLAIFLSNNPEFVGPNTLASVCPHDQEVIEYGCFIPTLHKIYILQIDDTELKPTELTSIAHETLHAIYLAMSTDERQQIDSELTSFYKSSSSTTLTKDAEPYQKENASTFTNELHSLTGSEVDLTSMPSILENHYGQYFSDQSKTVQANITFNQNIESQIESIKSQGDQLDTDGQKIRDYKVAHLDNIEAAMQQDSYYGDVYTYNLNVDAYNKNREIYNDMVAKYNTNVSDYNSARQNFLDAYTALFPDKSAPVPDAK